MLLADLQSRVRIALTTTLVDEWTLLAPSAGTSRPSERTISFHLGWALRCTIEGRWDLDADYDRSGMVLEDSVRFDGVTLRPPHLIVHRRGRLGPEHNLLLVELTADAAAATAGTANLAAARSVQQRFGYRYAVLLDLRLDDADAAATQVMPHWQWSTLEEGPVTDGPVPVYSPEVLTDLVARARRTGF
ncbi:hypothetical protein J1G42_01265 [Cellulomonas sp. zg-ZUI222]|uniref:hypothetical protein n=1 Tax=Cellulomonas wangleii TaxID=2816956 RepID=UPI001A9425BF|nr:hypothetical protein [Cellulomonas wangleii]MBO0919455.1 hypothetical protein [Cellulomonas wangleii]